MLNLLMVLFDVPSDIGLCALLITAEKRAGRILYSFTPLEMGLNVVASHRSFALLTLLFPVAVHCG